MHLIASSEPDVLKAYEIIRKELENFDKDLLLKKEIIVLSKTDEVTTEEVLKKKKELEKKLKKDVFTLSLFEDDSQIEFKKELMKILENKNKE